jgi:chromosome segregation ATPase
MKKVMTLLIMLSLVAFLFGFEDLNEDHWAYPAVNKLYEEGILEGIFEGDVFEGSTSVSRFELAVTLQNIMDYIDDGDKTNAEKLVALETRVKSLESIENSFEDLDVKTESNLRLLTALEKKVEEHYSELNKKYSDLSYKFSSLEEEVSGFGNRLSSLENEMIEVKNRLSSIEGNVGNLEKLYDSLVKKINEVDQKAEKAMNTANAAIEKANTLESQVGENTRSMNNFRTTINILIIANAVILIIALVGLFTP